jgi:hypothetical protein
MARRTITGVKLERLRARSRVLDAAVRMALVGCCVAIGFVVVATAFPQRRELLKLEANLQLAKNRESGILADREYHQIEYRALKEDPAFLEIHARDRLDLFRVGERILKFPSERR